MKSFKTNADGSVAIPVTIIEGVDSVVNKLRQEFRFFKSEYFLDNRLGVPYFESILVKNPNLIVVENLLKKIIYDTAEVLSILDFNMELSTDRVLTVNFKCNTIYGLIEEVLTI